jgi:hypothetical protein
MSADREAASLVILAHIRSEGSSNTLNRNVQMTRVRSERNAIEWFDRVGLGRRGVT